MRDGWVWEIRWGFFDNGIFGNRLLQETQERRGDIDCEDKLRNHSKTDLPLKQQR